MIESCDSVVGWIAEEPITWPLEVCDPPVIRTPALVASILALHAGYRLQGRIIAAIDARLPCPDSESLSSFLTYLLRYPNHIEMPEVSLEWRKHSVELKQSSERTPSNAPWVLASGGIDSTAALLWCLENGQRPMALWINYGQPYARPEEAAITSICNALGVPLTKLRVRLEKEIAQGTPLYQHIIPGRNFLLAALAAAMGAKRIILGGLVDEKKVPDKSPRFYLEASGYCGATISSPFLEMTKTAVLAVWRENWSTRIHPSATITCYSASGHCGRCRACIKRAIAFAASGWERDSSAQMDCLADLDQIIESDFLPRWDSLARERQLDMLLAFQNADTRLSPGIRAFAQRYIPMNNAALEARANELRTHLLPLLE